MNPYGMSNELLATFTQLQRDRPPFVDYSLRGHEYRLWLKDHLAIYGVRNAVLAPGYRSPDPQRLEARSD